ncbi:hypothetical protein EVAR_36686_1, partial [Eumeta japonica]
ARYYVNPLLDILSSSGLKKAFILNLLILAAVLLRVWILLALRTTDLVFMNGNAHNMSLERLRNNLETIPGVPDENKYRDTL